MKVLAAAVLTLVLSLCAFGQSSDTQIVVDAGKYYFISFDVDGKTRIAGKFRARGGRNDIECYIFDEDAFENWQNGHRANTWYNSGRVTVGRFDIRPPKGKYFLVFSNTFALVTNKIVTYSDID